MTAEEAEVLKLVRQTFEIVTNLEKRMASMTVKAAAKLPTGEIAADHDLDGQYGDPAIRKDPKRWTGDSFVGCKFSECPPEYLDEVASFKEWQAGKDSEKGTEDDNRKAKFNRLDAARARGWAKRKREGWAPAERVPGGDDEIPFA